MAHADRSHGVCTAHGSDPRRAFERVCALPRPAPARTFSCYDQLLCLAFAQLTYRESLRDIETCLRALQPKLYHAACEPRGAEYPRRCERDPRLADLRRLCATLDPSARVLYGDEPFAIALAQTVYAFDATTIDLCLALFPWARFRRTKAAVKLHTLLDLRGNIPTFVAITTARPPMSRNSMRWPSNQALSTCSTAATPTSGASTRAPRRWPSS